MSASTYLWGGASVTQAFQTNALLIIRVDEHGEPVEIGTRTAPATAHVIGTLLPGETYAVPLSGFAGVWARSPHPVDSHVDCIVLNNR